MPKNRIRIMTSVAMLTALSVALERFLPLVNTDTIRISLGNIPIVVASIFFGPFAGMLCGVISDLIGCLLSGYPPFPVLMLAPLAVGFIPGFAVSLFGKKVKGGVSNLTFLASVMTISGIIASVIITTIGLNILYGTPIVLLLYQRVPVSFLSILVDTAVLFLLLKNGILYKLFSIK